MMINAASGSNLRYSCVVLYLVPYILKNFPWQNIVLLYAGKGAVVKTDSLMVT